jgi:hypothetical protein
MSHGSDGQDDRDREPSDEDSPGDEVAPARQTPVLGPATGAMVGIIVFFGLGDRFSLLIRLAFALVVVAVVAYTSLLLARRRH